jgi:hypothetical protein
LLQIPLQRAGYYLIHTNIGRTTEITRHIFVLPIFTGWWSQKQARWYKGRMPKILGIGAVVSRRISLQLELRLTYAPTRPRRSYFGCSPDTRPRRWRELGYLHRADLFDHRVFKRVRMDKKIGKSAQINSPRPTHFNPNIVHIWVDRTHHTDA